MHPDLALDNALGPGSSPDLGTDELMEDEFDRPDARFDDPMSPDYVGPSLPFSEAGFREVLESLDAPPEDTPERRRAFARAREISFLVQDALAKVWPPAA